MISLYIRGFSSESFLKELVFIRIFVTAFVLYLTGLVSLFNGISTFVGYLMPKPFY